MTSSASESLIVQSKRSPPDVEHWLRLCEAQKTARSNFDTSWSSVARRIWPEADQFRTQLEPGAKRRQEVFSSHGSRALRKWVSIMLSLMVPKTSQWQQIKASDPELNKAPEVKAFFEELTRRAFKLRNGPRADFYGALAPVFSSLGAFGNGCFFLDDSPTGGVRYTVVPLSQVWIALDQYRRVVTVFHQYPMSAAAADMKWRKVWGSNPPEKVKQNLEKNPWGDMQWLHVVTPRGNVDPEALGPESMPYRSMHISVEDRQLVEEKGYHEMPYIFGREMVEANEIYGRGPGMVVLPELGTLNQMKKTHLVAGERVAVPPILMHDDGFGMGARRVNLLPNGLNFGALTSQGDPLMRPFETGAKLDITLEMMQEEKEAVDDAFGLNLFRILLEDPRANVTATEILQRAQEKGDLIAPGINSRQSEMLGPETERLVGIMSRQGLLPEVPEALLEAGEYEIEHSSPANRLQRAGELAAISQAIEIVTPLAAVDPLVLGKFKADKIIDRVMEIQGGTTDVLLTEDEYAEYRAQAAEQQQQAAMPEQAATGAGAMKDGAQALQLLQGGAQGA